MGRGNTVDCQLVGINELNKNDFVNILFNDDESEFALLVVKDVLGKIIDTISLKVAESKLYDVQMLKGGVYFFSLYINDTIIENKKIVLVK